MPKTDKHRCPLCSSPVEGTVGTFWGGKGTCFHFIHGSIFFHSFTRSMNLTSSINISVFQLPDSHLTREQHKDTSAVGRTQSEAGGFVYRRLRLGTSLYVRQCWCHGLLYTLQHRNRNVFSPTWGCAHRHSEITLSHEGGATWLNTRSLWFIAQLFRPAENQNPRACECNVTHFSSSSSSSVMGGGDSKAQSQPPLLFSPTQTLCTFPWGWGSQSLFTCRGRGHDEGPGCESRRSERQISDADLSSEGWWNLVCQSMCTESTTKATPGERGWSGITNVHLMSPSFVKTFVITVFLCSVSTVECKNAMYPSIHLLRPEWQLNRERT